MAPPLINLEVAVFSGSSGLLAQQQGAKRIELNAPGSYANGGLTPPVSELERLVLDLEVPVRLMIRPRGQPSDGDGCLPDFLYDEDEFAQMRAAVVKFKESGLLDVVRGDGFVFGILERRGSSLDVDEARCEILVNLARPFPCVFHRAFDTIAATDFWQSSLDVLAKCGFQGVLTSAGIGDCSNHVGRLVDIRRYAAGKNLQIIAGGGIRPRNAEEVAQQLILKDSSAEVWMHSAALKQREGRPPEEVDPKTVASLVSVLSTISSITD